jgi:hypothetical protein
MIPNPKDSILGYQMDSQPPTQVSVPHFLHVLAFNMEIRSVVSSAPYSVQVAWWY